MTPYYHAVSTSQTFGGKPEDYIAIHDWFDETKQYTGHWTHRAMRHHAAGIQWAIERFGHSITNSDGKEVPVKMIGEQHVNEDCGFIPTVAHWTDALKKNPEEWMLRVKKKSREVLKVEE
jgi:hypothetical protein